MIRGRVLFAALLIVQVNRIVDVSHGSLDPRVRYD